MSPAPPVFAEDPPSPARLLVERQLGLLTRLADIGMAIAEAAGRRAVAALEGEAPAEGADHRDPALAYDRAARAVRMTIALQMRLLENLPDLEKAEDRSRSDRDHARVNRVHRLVERTLEAQGPVDWRFSQALRDRLRDRDDYGGFLKLPFAEAVARICRDLGVTPDWSLFAADAEPETPSPAPSPAPPPDRPPALAAAAILVPAGPSARAASP